MYLIGIDLGTTGCKSMIFDRNGAILSSSYIEYELIQKGDGFIEQDAQLWWELVKKVVKDSVKNSGVDPAKIKAMAVSSQGIAFVPIDSQGNILYNAISWLDTRARSQTDILEKELSSKEFFYRTGKRLNPTYTLPKLMWFRENLPELYNRTYKFLMPMDYITWKLTGLAITDRTIASGTMAYNVHTASWDKEILERFDIDEAKLPLLGEMGSFVGYLQPAPAEELGLHTGVKVVLGGQDQKCAALGAGIDRGIATVSLGTATAISTVVDNPVLDPEMRVPCFSFYKNQWILESVISTSGAGLKWLRNTFFNNLSYSEMDELAEQSPPGSNGVFFYPHLEGAASPYWNRSIRGFLYGFGLSTNERDVIRSYMEGIAFQIKINLEIHEELNQAVQEIRLFGGGASSKAWCQWIADITGKVVSVLYTSETANLGAALLAGRGAGIYESNDEVIPKDMLIKKQFYPNKELRDCYDRIFSQYKEIQEKIL